MALKYKASPTFPATVAISVPGQKDLATLDVVFRHKGRLAFDEWLKSFKGRSDADVLADIIESCAGLVDEKGAPVEYNLTSLSAMLDEYPSAWREIYDAYRRELWESRAKN